MSNLHRIHWFDSQIRAGSYPNSSLLAKQFEISKRQAQRDIEYLAYSLSAPLLYVAKFRGYCYEDKTYALPLLFMTDEEKKILSYLSRRYRQYNYDGSTAINRIANLLDRFITDETEQTELRLPVFEMNTRLIDQAERLSHAVSQHFIVSILYQEGTTSESLTAWPLKLFSRYNSDYVNIYSITEQRQRILRLDSIVSMTITSAQFDPAELEALEWHNNTGKEMAKKPFTAKLKLHAAVQLSTWQGYHIRSNPEPDVAIVEFHDTDAFLQQLWIAKSAWETLLAPKWLIDKLERNCRDIIQQLAPTKER